jgi:hypothetical protein
MLKDTLLVALTLTGPALWWWPVVVEPSLDLPWWLPLTLVALWSGLATILSGGRWFRFFAASTVGTFVVLCCLAVWWPTDPIARSYLPFTVPIATLLAMLASLAAGLAVRKVSVSTETGRRAIWIALVCCFAVGPSAIALTPPLVAYRIKRNDRLAQERFESLKKAIEQTITQEGGGRFVCDGNAVKRYYSGPPFSESDWQRIAGNYVKQNGYVFMVYCHETGGYAIDAHPDRNKGDGTHRFCTDESKKVGCDLEWNRSRYACLPCSQLTGQALWKPMTVEAS